MQSVIIFTILSAFATIVATEPSNIVLILTDDQDDFGLALLSKLYNHKETLGVKFSNSFSTTPLCCPARSSILTGLYQHNHHVFNNSKHGGCNGEEWQNNFEPMSMGAIMKKAGYKTFYAGKYLNAYVENRVPKGWDWWAGLKGNSVYYNYTINVNGTEQHFGDKEEDYLTDVISNWSLDFLKMKEMDPFFMIIAPPAPHEPFTPSNKYKGRYSHLRAPRFYNFNTGKSGKHWLVRKGKTLSSSVIKQIDEARARRAETLQSVDDLSDAVLNIVPDNTYVFFTSDNGFHLGQFSQAWDKRQPYEVDIRVPLLVFGPRIPAGATLQHPVLNIDLAPTFYEIGGVRPLPATDGRSFLSILHDQPLSWNRSFTIEYQGEGGDGEPCYVDDGVKLCRPELQCNCFDARNNSFTCTRHLSLETNTLYCQFHDAENFIESYNLKDDPYQLINLRALKAKSDAKNAVNPDLPTVLLIGH